MTATTRFMGWFSGVGKAASEVLPVRLGGQRFPGKLATPVRMAGLDWALLWVTLALLMWGLVMVYSASVAMPDNPKFARYAHTHFLTRHVLALAVAFLVPKCKVVNDADQAVEFLEGVLQRGGRQ